MSTRYGGMPLAADDLRDIAKLMDRAEKLLYEKETGEFRLDKGRAVTGDFRVPVLRPDGLRSGAPIGHLVAEDGWVGFIPLGDDEL